MQRNLQNYVTDPDYLKKWLLGLEQTQWNLYRGFHSRVPERDVIWKQQDSTLPIDDSYNLLWEHISYNSNGSGMFTVYVPAYKGNKAATIHFGVNLQPTTSMPSPGVGVHGMPQAGGYASLMGVQEAIANEREKWEMKQQIKDLEAAIEYKSSWQDILMEKFMQMDPDQMIAKVAGVMSTLTARPGVQLQGVQSDYQPQNAGPEPPAPGYQYAEELVIPWLDSIRVHFSTDEQFWEFMNAVSVRFNQAPDMFKTMVGNG